MRLPPKNQIQALAEAPSLAFIQIKPDKNYVPWGACKITDKTNCRNKREESFKRLSRNCVTFGKLAIPLAKVHRCFSIKGFSLHANTSTNSSTNSSTNTLARDSLRKLVEYTSRGSLSSERLKITK